jgi:hypothetical protein
MTVFGFAARTDPGELESEGATVFREMSSLPDLLGASR